MESDRKARLAKLAAQRAQRPRGRPKARLSTLTEIAEYLNVSRHTIYRLMASKGFPYLRIGYVLRFDLPTVLQWAADFTSSGDKLTWADDYPGMNRPRARGADSADEPDS